MLLKNLGQILINISVLIFYLGHHAYLHIIETNIPQIKFKKPQNYKALHNKSVPIDYEINYEEYGDNFPIY